MSLLNRVAGPEACNFIKKNIQHRCFLMNFVKLLKHFLHKVPPGILKLTAFCQSSDNRNILVHVLIIFNITDIFLSEGCPFTKGFK